MHGKHRRNPDLSQKERAMHKGTIQRDVDVREKGKIMLDMSDIRIIHHFPEMDEVEGPFFIANRNDRYGGPRFFKSRLELCGIISYTAL